MIIIVTSIIIIIIIIIISIILTTRIGRTRRPNPRRLAGGRGADHECVIVFSLTSVRTLAVACSHVAVVVCMFQLFVFLVQFGTVRHRMTTQQRVAREEVLLVADVLAGNTHEACDQKLPEILPE